MELSSLPVMGGSALQFLMAVYEAIQLFAVLLRDACLGQKRMVHIKCLLSDVTCFQIVL